MQAIDNYTALQSANQDDTAPIVAKMSDAASKIPFEQLVDALGISSADPSGFQDASTRNAKLSDAAPINYFGQANAGTPAMFSTWTEPKVRKALVVPCKAALIYGETQKGDWKSRTGYFPESAVSGFTTSYAPGKRDGATSANDNWVPRQSFLYQTWTEWDDYSAAMYSQAKIDWIAQQNAASIEVLKKAQNAYYLKGVEGLNNRGVLNDTNLREAITPNVKVSPSGTSLGGGQWTLTNDPMQVYGDIMKAVQELVDRTGGLIDTDTPMTLVVPSERMTFLNKSNQFMGFTVKQLLKQNFPNLKIVTLPEMGARLSGGMNAVCMFQLFANRLEGDDVVTCAFNTKLRTFAVEIESDVRRQKKIQGTFGAFWFRPMAQVTMAGI